MVKPGYKQTEVGVIPEDWDIDYVENLARITTGSRNTQDRVPDGQYPFFVRSQTIERIDTFSYDCEGVLTAGDGVGTGKIFHYVNGKFDVHQRVYLINDFSKRIDASFFYLIFSNRFYDRIMQMTAKTSVDSVRREMISRMQIPFPSSLTEQDAIASALSDVDALIESLERLIAKKRDIKRATMRKLLDPGPEWVKKRLGDTAIIKARIGWQGLTTSEYLDSGNYYLVTGTDFENGFIDWDNCHYVDESRYLQDRHIQLKQSDILVTKDGTIGKVAFVDGLQKPATLNSGVFVVRPINGAFEPEFFYHLLHSEMFSKFLDQLSAGSTINHLYQKDFVDFEYLTPESLSEQKNIAATLTAMDKEKSAINLMLKKTREIKQGMMQELLTGRIRLV